MQVERTRYEAGVAERRYKRTDPDNRLVAGTLEAEWNGKLLRLREAEQYEQMRLTREKVTSVVRTEVLRLAEDFPRIWQDVQTADRERKRMARLLLDDVTIIRDQEQITAHLRFKGGAQQTLLVPATQHTDPKAVALVDSLLEQNRTYAEIAADLNEHGMRTPRGNNYSAQVVRGIIVRRLPHHSARPDNQQLPATTSIQDDRLSAPSAPRSDFGGAV